MRTHGTRRTEQIGALCTALAAAVVMAGASAAQGAMVYSGMVNITVPATSSGIFINVENGLHSGEFVPAPAGWDVNIWGTGASSIDFWSGATGTTYMRAPGAVSGTTVANLADGVVVGSGGSFATSPNASFSSGQNGHWNYNSVNTFGFKFLGTGGYRYGWMHVRVGATALDRTIVDYAYDNSGGTVTAGAVPGPAGLSVLALGSAVARRRRRA